MKDLKAEKSLAAKQAVKLIENNQIIGLGTGSTAYFAVLEIGRLVEDGLKIKAVPTSNATAELAESLHIPLLLMDEVDSIDLTIDGTDEFDADLNLIKGGGGALFREKMVARLSKREIIIADSSKKVEVLGAFKVPVEVVPIALNYANKQIRKINGTAKIREKDGKIFVTDAGNYILDADFGKIKNAEDVSEKLNRIEGVVCHGLFIGLAQMVIMADGDETIIFNR
ncbi:MAG: ribose-5-phosphate isomerase RpiA [Acidobacteria bacterium]|jgi:ribose 5-phosphate isomerase A|nr:ribose-5-phosphate isomerase RpiA [Acidobacteriota bacterium]